MSPVLLVMVDTCVVCGDVACERDLLWVDTQDDADAHDCVVGDLICRDCAGDDEEEVRS